MRDVVETAGVSRRTVAVSAVGGVVLALVAFGQGFDPVGNAATPQGVSKPLVPRVRAHAVPAAMGGVAAPVLAALRQGPGGR